MVMFTQLADSVELFVEAICPEKSSTRWFQDVSKDVKLPTRSTYSSWFDGFSKDMDPSMEGETIKMALTCLKCMSQTTSV